MALANTIFSGKGDDTLLAQDIYALNDSNPINNIPVKTLGSTIADAMSNIFKPNNLKEIAATVGAVAAGQIDKGTVLNKLKQNIGAGVINGLASSNPSLVQKLAAAVEQAPELKNNVLIRNGGQTKLLQTDLASAVGMAALTNGVTGNQDIQVEDLSTKASLVNGVIAQATQSQSMDVVDLLLGDPNNTEIVHQALKSNVPTMAANSDIAGLKKSVQVIGSDGVLGGSPNVIQQTLASYTNSKMSLVNYNDNVIDVSDTFHQIDPNWNEVQRNGRSEIKVASYSGISDQLLNAMKYDDQHGEAALLASQYGSIDITKELKSFYGNLAVS